MEQYFITALKDSPKSLAYRVCGISYQYHIQSRVCLEQRKGLGGAYQLQTMLIFSLIRNLTLKNPQTTHFYYYIWSKIRIKKLNIFSQLLQCFNNCSHVQYSKMDNLWKMAEIAKLLMKCGIMINNHSLSFFFCQNGQNHFLLLCCSYFF